MNRWKIGQGIIHKIYKQACVFLNVFFRVLTLEHKKTEILPKVNQKAAQAEENDSPSDDEAEFDEYLDWRSKKSFKR